MFIVLVGPPGSGKGTQASRLVEYLRIPHMSTGVILRVAKQENTPVASQIAECIDQGQLVNDDLIMQLVDERLRKADCRHGCLFDGVPRTLNQAERLEEMLARSGVGLSDVIALEVPRAELVRRLTGRSGIEGRADDTPATIEARMEVYDRQTAPLLELYRKKGLLRTIDAMGTPDEVFRRIRASLHEVVRA